MRESEPSRTAMGAALYRAAHQLVDIPPVFRDPLALVIIGREAEQRLRTGGDPRTSARASELRAFIAVRSRVAEDALREAMARSVSQYVLIGAGLDTFAYRGSYDSERLRVFEVDHPATQAWKRALLARASIAIPPPVMLAPVDFERQTLCDALTRADFDFTRPAMLAWLGVVPYLTREVVLGTLRVIATHLPSRSEVVFDYAAPATQLSDAARAARSAFAERLAEHGEPLRSQFEPEALAREVTSLGFVTIEDLDARALNGRHFATRTDGLAVRGRGHVVRVRT